jgi:hypothetical protein
MARVGLEVCKVDGCKDRARQRGMCWKHNTRFQKTGDPTTFKPSYKTYPIGATRMHNTGYVEEKISPNKWELQHRLVMKRSLGRDLLPGENIHHKDGNRANNDLDNLELWSTGQPAGQKVEDKINWAIGFLSQYGYKITKEN